MFRVKTSGELVDLPCCISAGSWVYHAEKTALIVVNMAASSTSRRIEDGERCVRRKPETR